MPNILTEAKILLAVHSYDSDLLAEKRVPLSRGEKCNGIKFEIFVN